MVSLQNYIDNIKVKDLSPNNDINIVGEEGDTAHAQSTQYNWHPETRDTAADEECGVAPVQWAGAQGRNMSQRLQEAGTIKLGLW